MINLINFKKTTYVVLILFLTAFILLAGRGKSDEPGDGGKKDPEGGGKKDGNTNGPKLELGKQKFTLMGIFPTPPSGRNSWIPCPADASPWFGNNSATTLYDNPSTKYYCVLNIVCTQYNYNEFVVWTNDPGQIDLMTITIPTNATFTIFVEYYEPCGNYWTNGVNGRGKWATLTPQLTANTSGATQPIGNFYYVRKESGC